MNIGWPEGIMLALMAGGLVIHAAIDGDERKIKPKFSVALVRTAITLGLLWWGGFFA